MYIYMYNVYIYTHYIVGLCIRLSLYNPQFWMVINNVFPIFVSYILPTESLAAKLHRWLPG